MCRLLLYTGFFAVVFLGSPLLRAQPSRVTHPSNVTQPAGVTQPSGLAFEHLSMQQGLPSDWINSMLIDHKGYIWVATSNGLSRYNGYDFVTYKFNPHDPQSLNQNLTLSLFEDKDGDIWVGNVEGGVNRFDRGTEKFINYRPPQPPGRFETVLRSVSAMNEDKQGLYWVASFSGELRRFDKKTGRFSSFDYPLDYHPSPGDLRPFDQIHCIYRDKHHDLWVGNKSGLHLLVLKAGITGAPFDSASAYFKTFAQDPADTTSLEGQEVFSVFEDHAGALWVSADTTLNLFDRKTGRCIHYRHNPADPTSYSGGGAGTIAEDADGYLWITVNHGMDRLDPQRQHFEHFVADPHDPNSMKNIGSSHLVIDKAGNIWIGGYGIDKLNPKQPPIRTYRYDMPSHYAMKGVFSTMMEDHLGTVWVCNGDGLSAMDRRTGKFTHYRHDPANRYSISSNFCSAMLEDGEGMIWVASWSGTLDRFDPRTGRFTHYIGPDGRFKNVERHYYRLLFQDHRGVIWVGENSSGVTALDYRQGTIRHFGHNPADPAGLSDYQTNCIAEDRQGYLWIGHGSVATDRLDPRTGLFRHYQYQPGNPGGISSNCVNVIMTDSKGRMWFGTLGGGICRYDESTAMFTTYTEKDGLLDNTINSIVEDNTGSLWLGTGAGICRFFPDTRTFTDFNYPNMPVDNPSTMMLGKTPDGWLWFNNVGDIFSTFDPAALHPNTYVPPVVITRFRVFSQDRPGSDEMSEIELPYNQNFFSFEFSALNYTDSRKNQYAYRLEGVDKQWVHSGTRRVAAYTDVAPGTYTFRVKGSNNEGVWNDSDASVRIVIYPPWWRTWWAYAAYALAILATWYYLERRHQKRLIARERDRGKARELEMQALRAQMNPHFIFNSLTSINRFILKNDRLSASDYLTRFSRLIRMVLNHSRLMLIPLDDELDMLRLYLDMEKLRFKEVFSYTIDAGNDADRENILIPPMLFQPFVENAIWHGLMHKSEPGRLDILLRIDGDILTCTITDNGVGRIVAAAASSKSAQKRKSMGIDITQQRLNLINGSADNGHGVKIEDLYDDHGQPAGTRVTIRIHTRTSQSFINQQL
jgi:ligand-binding sensor domain-containing protein